MGTLSYMGLATVRSRPFDRDRWTIYRRVLRKATEQGIQFAIGGGLATRTYTGRDRESKDLDVFVAVADREKIIRVLASCGLQDYYEQQPYDRTWIYRGFLNGAILDVIWAMANHRALVDRDWLVLGPEIRTDGMRLQLAPPEETLWAKLYVMQHDRCDWPDALNIIYAVGPDLDWRRLLKRLESDAPLLGGLLSVFAWMCPDRARELPEWLWEELEISRPGPSTCLEFASARANLLDTRDWFTPTTQNDAGA